MYGDACNIPSCRAPLDLYVIVWFIATYHNSYAIIVVVMAFVALEAARPEIVTTYDVYDAA